MAILTEITGVDDVVETGTETLSRILITGLEDSSQISISWKQISAAYLVTYEFTNDGIKVNYYLFRISTSYIFVIFLNASHIFKLHDILNDINYKIYFYHHINL